MGNKSQAGIQVHTEKSYYLPGQIVQGNVYISTSKPYPCQKIILHITGTEKSWFRQNTGNDSSSNSIASNQSLKSVQPNDKRKVKIKSINGEQIGQNKIIQSYFTLVCWNKQSNLHGQYVFPFLFQLPSYIPGSFHEENTNYRASINYMIKALCLSPKSKFPNIEKTIDMIIRQPQRNQQDSMYGQIYVYPISCGCVKHGVSRICCYFEKNQYMPGEQCIAICQVDSIKCSLKIKQIKVQFFKEVVLTSTFGEQRQYLKQIRSISFPGVASYGMYTEQNAQKVHLPLKYRDQKTQIHPSTQGRLVQCTYFLQVTPIFGGMCVANSSFFRINVNILQEGLIQPKIEQPDNWNPQVFKKSEIFFDRNDLKNQNLNQMKG